MGWLTKHASGFGPSHSVGNDDGWFVRAIGGGRTHAGPHVSEYTALNITAVYGSVSIIADLVGMIPLRVYQQQGERRDPVTEHPLVSALGRQMNPYMTPYTGRQTTMGHALLWGNGYLEIEKNRRGQAVNLWPLLPESTYVRRRDFSGRSEIVYDTTIDGESFTLPHDRIAHIKSFGHDGYCGYSPIALHRQALGMALATEKFGAKFFGNDAKSGGFLYHPGTLSQRAHQNLENSTNKVAGLDNAHRVRVLEEGMKFQQTTIPPEDAQFLGTREFQIAEIARMFRVPLVLLQSHEKSTAWGTGVEQFVIGFRSFTLQPWTRCWEEELNAKLFTPEEQAKGLVVRFNLKELARGDMAGRGAFFKQMVEMGAMSPNEVRGAEDMNEKPELDKHYVPKNWRGVDEPDTDAAASQSISDALSE